MLLLRMTKSWLVKCANGDISRFSREQGAGAASPYERALAELRAGRKRTRCQWCQILIPSLHAEEAPAHP
jgi:hypothetical protein